jgi:hypothetical protein
MEEPITEDGRLMNRIPLVGEVAPDFAAMAFHDGVQAEVTLSRYRGWWVILIFYPGDFTCVCPTEIAAAAVKYPAFRELGSEVLVVSTDTVDTHREFQEKELSRMVSGGARFSARLGPAWRHRLSLRHLRRRAEDEPPQPLHHRPRRDRPIPASGRGPPGQKHHGDSAPTEGP